MVERNVRQQLGNVHRDSTRSNNSQAARQIAIPDNQPMILVAPRRRNGMATQHNMNNGNMTMVMEIVQGCHHIIMQQQFNNKYNGDVIGLELKPNILTIIILPVTASCHQPPATALSTRCSSSPLAMLGIH